MHYNAESKSNTPNEYLYLCVRIREHTHTHRRSSRHYLCRRQWRRRTPPQSSWLVRISNIYVFASYQEGSSAFSVSSPFGHYRRYQRTYAEWCSAVMSGERRLTLVCRRKTFFFSLCSIIKTRKSLQ